MRPTLAKLLYDKINSPKPPPSSSENKYISRITDLLPPLETKDDGETLCRRTRDSVGIDIEKLLEARGHLNCLTIDSDANKSHPEDDQTNRADDCAQKRLSNGLSNGSQSVCNGKAVDDEQLVNGSEELKNKDWLDLHNEVISIANDITDIENYCPSNKGKRSPGRREDETLAKDCNGCTNKTDGCRSTKQFGTSSTSINGKSCNVNNDSTNAESSDISTSPKESVSHQHVDNPNGSSSLVQSISVNGQR